MSRYQPPRRESIEDHLRVARARVKLSGAGWTEKLASPPGSKISSGKTSSAARLRAEGERPRVGQRLAPRDYRDLLRIIDLKSQGVSHRSAWIAYLWICGRNYPIDRVRDAFCLEIKRMTKTMLTEFAPRERLQGPRVTSFGKRYDRRVRKRDSEAENPPGFADIAEPFVALGMSRQFLPQIGTDPNAITKLVSEATGYPASELAPAMAVIVDAMKAGRTLSTQEQEQLREILGGLWSHAGLGALFSDPDFFSLAAQGPVTMEGSIGTFSRRKESTLLHTIEVATPLHWELARRQLTHVCSGKMEYECSLLITSAESDARRALDILVRNMADQRMTARASPRARVHLFVHYLHDLVLTGELAKFPGMRLPGEPSI